jgi:hypothetical protein
VLGIPPGGVHPVGDLPAVEEAGRGQGVPLSGVHVDAEQLLAGYCGRGGGGWRSGGRACSGDGCAGSGGFGV